MEGLEARRLRLSAGVCGVCWMARSWSATVFTRVSPGLSQRLTSCGSSGPVSTWMGPRCSTPLPGMCPSLSWGLPPAVVVCAQLFTSHGEQPSCQACPEVLMSAKWKVWQ